MIVNNKVEFKVRGHYLILLEKAFKLLIKIMIVTHKFLIAIYNKEVKIQIIQKKV
jgi:hypothetical protein